MPRQPGRVNVEWETPKNSFQWQHVEVEVLMDIREELRRLNGLLHCSNFVGIPATLKSIARNIPARRPRRKKP